MDEPRIQPHRDGVDRPGADLDPADALREAVAQATELKEYAGQYLSAKADLARLSVRRTVIWIVVGTLSLVVASVVVGMSVGLLLSGLAEGIGVAMNGRRWAGNLIVGGGILLILGGGTWMGIRIYERSSLRATVKRYERKHQEQRTAHGFDARDRAEE